MAQRNKPINPARVMSVGFVGLILLGSLLLSLPQAHNAESIAYMDALFTSASAVCVTGLVVLDTGTFYSTFGQSVIMVLIFIGSLGFMTMTTMIFVFLGRRISLVNRLIIKDTLNQDSLGGTIALVKAIATIALTLILVGTVIISFRFVPDMGFKEGLFYALFHAISSFGNAGFDLFGNFTSLTEAPTDYLVNGTIMGLFIIGGLGFTVILEVLQRVFRGKRLSLHSRMVIIITIILILFGTTAVLISEYKNPATMGELTLGGRVFASLFTASTPRTAGFSITDTSQLYDHTLIILMVLMFIGASPTSTGGGIKTTTVGIILFNFFSLISGRKSAVIFRKRLPDMLFMKAVSIVIAAVSLVLICTFVLTFFEDESFIALLFEAISAFATVGLSRGITPDLSNISKAILIVTMLGGRIGPLSLFVALTRQKREEVLQYPEENILIG